MRISGVTIPDKKQLHIALTEVYGVGRPRAAAILSKLGIDASRRPGELSEEEESMIRKEVESLPAIEGELRREVSQNIKRLKDIQAYRGSRHSKRLPTRGQRTKTNARTLKGVKKTMGSGRTKVDKK